MIPPGDARRALVPQSMPRVLLIALLVLTALRPAFAQSAEAAVPAGNNLPIVVDLPGIR